ncbi:hypothetical protein FJW05_03550 [Mesorhizobium sp. B2-9-1]|uniref:hypothetical protein n=1 Tax=Mesorhizobium sp. B2-9-1 TaxID=2589898 RepID=UPI00112D3667|nr:hypothetical protein [Mesorhizobium sp. B2-9-1]TPI50147.1 hypothetical protein FJW05_03550 [Mesorhizobium sp. B2-9-1]
MSAPSRISIVETGGELIIGNPPRRSAVRIGFVLLSLGIVAVTAHWGFLDRSPETIAMGLVGLVSFLAVVGLFAYFLGKELLWLASAGEELRATRAVVLRETRGTLLPNRASLAFSGQLSVEILDHLYPTDEAGLKEVVRFTSATGSISFGRELSRPEAEAVAEAVRRFTAPNHSYAR